MGKYFNHTAKVFPLNKEDVGENHMLAAWCLMGNCYTETQYGEHS